MSIRWRRVNTVALIVQLSRKLSNMQFATHEKDDKVLLTECHLCGKMSDVLEQKGGRK